ncbi:MAG: T9SS type A sorting domain-containing protein, partial [Bacteroidota bacterium]
GTVTCQNYNWTAGAVDVLTGIFTANNLLDNGLWGNYYVNPGGTINLHNTDGYVDLNGNLYVYGGNFNIWGGSGSNSWWPYVNNGSVTMSGGVLDFKDVGVYVYNTGSYTFSENITGGTIRTSRDFTVERADYTPTGGTVEFYGPTDGNFKTINGGYVRNVIVNKGVADNSGSGKQSISRDRQTGAVTDVPMANTITLSGDADINGSVTIQNGILAAGAYTINVEGNWDNQVGTAGFDEGTSIVDFDGLPYSQIINGETFYNFWESKTNTDYYAVELLYGMTMNVTHNLYMWDGSLELNGATTLNGGIDVQIGAGAGINANDYPAIAINVSGNWSNGNADYDLYHGFDPGYYSTVTFNGTTDQIMWTNCTQEDFCNLTINKASGRFIPKDNTQSFRNILIQNGDWEDFASGYTHSVYGNFTVAPSGSFLTTAVGNTVEFKGDLNSILSYSGVLGYFRNILVNKSSGYSVTQATGVYTQFGGNLTVGTGTYNLDGNFLFVAGDVTVNSTGILSLPAASTMVLTDTKTLNVNSGGRIDIAGTSGSQVNIRSNVPASARYAFNVNSGGTIAADYCIFKNMGVNGINVKSGADIDLAHSFKGCTFQDGANNGTLLTIDNSQTRTIRNAVFPTNTWSGASNVTKTVNAGSVYFVDYSGAWSGEDHDNDFYNRIQWVPTLVSVPTATPSTICPGSPSQLHAVASGGVAPYTYAWTPTGSLSNPAIENPVATPLLTTPYAVLVTDALGTTVTGNVTLTVLPTLTPSVLIVPSANPSVPGDYVNYTATPFNGGASPTYVWKVNGSGVGTGPTYFYKPSNHDQVTCEMTSSYACLTGNPAISNMITMVVIPVNRTETGTINAPLLLCFDASNTITVAGGGNVFIVKSGASAVFIAGVKISFLPGTLVENGGYLHGFIATTNNYCGFVTTPAPSVVAGEGEVQTEPLLASQMFSIYPNPTSGKFTLQNKGNVVISQVQVEIFDLRGLKVYSTSYTGERSHQINLPPFMPGLYFVKVTAGDQLESFKLVVTR